MRASDWNHRIPDNADTDDAALRRWQAALSDATSVRLLLAVGRRRAREAELAELLKLSRAEVSRHVGTLLGHGFIVRHRRGRTFTNPPIWRATERGRLVLRALLDPSDGKDRHQPGDSAELRLAILRAVDDAAPDGLGGRQVAALCHVHAETARRNLRALWDAGLVEGAVTPAVGSHRSWSTTYTLTQAGAEALAAGRLP